MSKKRKTKKEKVLSQIRQEQSSHETIYSFTEPVILTVKQPKETPLITPTTHTQTAYVMHDVKKTLSASFVLMLFITILFILMHYNFITLGYLGY